MQHKESLIPSVLLTILICSQFYLADAQSLDQFQNPPSNSKALTWWHWINGNVTKSGIKKDMEMMEQVGIGGVILFNVGFYSPGDSPFMSDAWWSDVSYAMQKADSLGMKFGVFNSDGWSMSGGPWIEPEESMKQLVWTDTTIQGDNNVKLKLKSPLVNSIYHDIVTLAYPAVENEKALKVSSILDSEELKSPEAAIDGNPETKVFFPSSETGGSALTVDFNEIKPVRRVVFDKVQAKIFLTAFATIEYSLDGNHFQKIDQKVPLNLKSQSAIKTFTLTFPEIEARYIKVLVSFNETEDNIPFYMYQENIAIGEISFYESPRVTLWESKSGQSTRIRHDRQQLNQKEMAEVDEESIPKEYIISAKNIIDLTDRVDEDGNLDWKAPAGDWTILRLGYTSTNKTNAPASKSGRGLECDKMNPAAARKHFNGYVARMNDLSLKLRGKPLDFMQMESWEAGIQNWTRDFDKEFEKRNGYSIIPWLPVMAGGRIVNSAEESNRFLWDLRRTIANMISENYWEVMNDLAHEKGIEVLGEGSGMHHYFYDPNLYHKTNDIPMGEFWTTEEGPRADCKNAASVAHVYGKRLVAAEAFTGSEQQLWRMTPYDFKKIGDEAFALGVNQFVLHSYVHQPYDIAPGFTLSQFGNHFQRLNTWFTKSDGWFDYINRSQYMLQQGELVTDVCYFTGEGIPGYLGLRNELNPKLPKGYDYDGIGFEKLKEMEAVNGKLRLPNGATYHLLVFPETKKMTPELIHEIERLVKNGATIVSVKPESSPSLSGYPECDDEVKKLADKIWGEVDSKLVTETSFGSGKILWGIEINSFLKSENVKPDFRYSAMPDNGLLNYTHRKSGNTDIYFVANNKKETLYADCFFRVNQKNATVWDVDDGQCKKVKTTVSDGGTNIPLEFDPLGSVFVVFNDSMDHGNIGLNQLPEPKSEVEIGKNWVIKFLFLPGDTNRITTTKLKDWTEFDLPDIKYFSGTASYNTTFFVPEVHGNKMRLDLGDVKNIARVFVNDVYAGNLWKPPFKIDISENIKPGENNLRIEITNTMVNRMVGDEQLPADINYRSFPGALKEFPLFLKNGDERNSGRKTFVTYNYFSKESELEPSGLIGPVKLEIYD